MQATPVTVWESLQTQGFLVENGIVFIDPDNFQPTVDPDGLSYNTDLQILQIKNLAMPQGMAGTNGDITLNAPTGQVSFAAAGQILTLNNSFIENDSLIFVSLASNDTTAKSAIGINLGGGTHQAQIRLDVPATAITKVNFWVIQPKA